MSYPDALKELIARFGKLPGIGSRTAERLALHVLDRPREDAEALARALIDAKNKVRPCPLCGNYSSSGPCPVCADAGRDSSTLCVVESARDITAIEKSGRFRGRYHVLGGKLSPIKGIGPSQLRTAKLFERIEKEGVEEVILATGADMEGETTALYMAEELKDRNVRTSRIAYGIPVGNSLDYTDELTLIRAIEGRTRL